MNFKQWFAQQHISKVSSILFWLRILCIVLILTMAVLVAIKFIGYVNNKSITPLKDITQFTRARIKLSDTSLGSNILITGTDIIADCSPVSGGTPLSDYEGLISWQYTFNTNLDDSQIVWTSFVDNVSTLATSLQVPTYRYGQIYIRVASAMNPDKVNLVLGNAKGYYKFTIKPSVTWSGPGVESVTVQRQTNVVWTYTTSDNTVIGTQGVDVYYRLESSDVYTKATTTPAVDVNAFTVSYTLDSSVAAGFYYFKIATNNMVAKGFDKELEFEFNELVEVTSGVQSLSTSSFGSLVVKSSDGKPQSIFSPNETVTLYFSNADSYTDLKWYYSVDGRTSWQTITLPSDSYSWVIPSNIALNTKTYIRVTDSLGVNKLETFFTIKMYMLFSGDTKEEVTLDDYKDRQDVLGNVQRAFNINVYGYSDIQTLQDVNNWYVGWVTLKNTLNNATGMRVTGVVTSNMTNKKVFCRLTVDDQGVRDAVEAYPLYFRFFTSSTTIEYTSNRTYRIVMT